tara:strand:- start:1637 stop:1951 length:315 start_codon:yes stop_codon:yes gene_type:complete
MWPFSKIEELKMLNNSKQKKILKLKEQLSLKDDLLDSFKERFEQLEIDIQDETDRRVMMAMNRSEKEIRTKIITQQEEFEDTVIRLKLENIELKKIITDIEHGK